MNHSDIDQVRYFLKTRKKDVIFLGIGLFIGIVLNWDLAEIFIFEVLIWSILGPISSQILAGIALFFLASTPILLLFGRDAQAEQYAVYAYYFLVMAVIRGIIEVRGKKNDGVMENEP